MRSDQEMQSERGEMNGQHLLQEIVRWELLISWEPFVYVAAYLLI
jgi:hypothetical protein